MDTQLTHAARIQLARSLRRRYQAASSRAKKQILNEFIAVSGYHPKYAIHLLNAAEAGAPRLDVGGYAPPFTTTPRSRR